MPSRISLWVACGVLQLLGALVRPTNAAPTVPGFERFHAAAQSDSLRGGMVLLGELNCVACHQIETTSGIEAKQAPRLDEVGKRVRPEYLRQFLTNPPKSDVGTTMPHVLHSLDSQEQWDQIEALVHFLAATGPFAESAPVAAGVNRGRQLFHTVGCLACHDRQPLQGSRIPTSVPLENLAAKYGVPGLTAFLQDPLHVRPSARMPHLNLTAEEARDIACFLLRDLKVPTSMTFQYYEGSWEKLPDFSKLPVKGSGGAASFDVNVGAADHFAVRFQGKFRVETDGQYRFFLASDDGSRFLIDGREVLVNDGIHAMTEKDTKYSLTAGEHDFVVEYFEGGGEQSLRLEYQGQGVKQQSLEFALVPPAQTPKRETFTVNAELVKKGREIFQSAGCASCHEMRSDGVKLASRLNAKKLIELGSGGCLSESPVRQTPFFDLTDRQRDCLQQALIAVREGKANSKKLSESISHTLTTFNCYACHDRNGLGGPEEIRNAHFRSNQPEMGDEGRLPPSLNGVGAKLQPGWLSQVVEKGAKDRTYMLTRMPRFGRNPATLTAALTDSDHEEFLKTSLGTSGPTKNTEPERKLKATGRQLVGEKGMSCVKCHTWGNVKATGIQAISLTTMSRRLRHDWFHSYLLNPQLYRPGTRMPAAWPGGQSPFANILDGDANRQIHAIWLYLKDGNDAAMPAGIGQQPIELRAEKEPILYRNFVEGAGTRAIGVGYPEQLNLAFDANDCRLALVWQGAFIDASMHWVGRGQGFQRPLGDNVLKFIEGPAFAALQSLDGYWPAGTGREHGMQFSGYRLDELRRPVFLYRWHKVQIEDSIQPVIADKRIGLKRSIVLKGDVEPPSWFRAAVAKKIEESENGRFLIDDDWQIQVQSSCGKPMVRASQGRQELLLPISGGECPATLTIEIDW